MYPHYSIQERFGGTFEPSSTGGASHSTSCFLHKMKNCFHWQCLCLLVKTISPPMTNSRDSFQHIWQVLEQQHSHKGTWGHLVAVVLLQRKEVRWKTNYRMEAYKQRKQTKDPLRSIGLSTGPQTRPHSLHIQVTINVRRGSQPTALYLYLPNGHGSDM